MKNRDKIRSVLRSAVPKSVYAKGARLLDASRVVATQGVSVWRTLTSPANSDEELRSVTLKQYAHPFYFRPGTVDVNTLIQTLIREEYGHLLSDIRAKLVIDAGGNIGDTAVYFLTRFKGCRVVTLEPHPMFFAIAERNLAPYPNVTLLRRGLWSCETHLGLSDDSTSSSVEGKANHIYEIECVDVGTLLQAEGASTIDILKLDIEGAERDVLLNNSQDWLPRTRMIVAELHGPDVTEECSRFLVQKGFEGFRFRELHYFVNRAMTTRERGTE